MSLRQRQADEEQLLGNFTRREPLFDIGTVIKRNSMCSPSAESLDGSKPEPVYAQVGRQLRQEIEMLC